MAESPSWSARWRWRWRERVEEEVGEGRSRRKKTNTYNASYGGTPPLSDLAFSSLSSSLISMNHMNFTDMYCHGP